MKTIQGRFRAAVLMGAAASVLVFAAGAKAQNQNSNDNPWPVRQFGAERQSVAVQQSRRSPVLAVVGDVACQPGEDGAEW